MLDVNDVCIHGKCVGSKKLSFNTNDLLILTLETNGTTVKVKVNGDKDKLFPENEYLNSQIRVENGKIELEEYKTKKGDQVKEFVIKANANKMDILTNPCQDLSIGKVEGKVVSVDGDYVTVESKYLGGGFQGPKEYKSRYVRVKPKSISNVQNGKSYVFHGSVGSNPSSGVFIDSAYETNTYSKRPTAEASN